MNGRDLFMGLVVVVIWGLNFIAIKVGLQDMPPLLLGTLRFLVATLPAIFFLPRPPIAWRWLLALGLALNVGQFAFLFMGMKLGMSAGLASLLLQSQAFFTLAVAVAVLRERWFWHHIAGLVTAAGGMAVIGLQQGGNVTVIGFGLVLLAACSWGIGNVILRRATRDIPPFSMLALVVWAGAVAIIPLAILSLCVEGATAWVDALRSLNSTTVGSLVYLAYFATLCGYALWGKLLAKYPAAAVSPLALLVPVVGISSSALLLGEVLSGSQVIGALLVMLGLVIHVFGGRLTRPADVLLNEK
ncbi:MAG TPA: EamA family transporter [Patescibacteria group bacterium]|nr:EamA family transporter [Patescibacteria group bacterium]